MAYFFFYVILNAVKNPTTKVKHICSVLFRWDISLTLNMTYFYYLSVFLISTHRIARDGIHDNRVIASLFQFVARPAA